MSASETKPIRLAVFLSGGGRTLRNIMKKIDAGELNAEVAVVIASRECEGLERAQRAGLDAKLVPYRSFMRPDGSADVKGYSAGITAHLEATKVDLICMAGFLSMWEIPPNYEWHVINIHPALLPAFGGRGMFGRHVHEAVLARGCKVSGCTAHFVTNEYDSGPIIIQRAVEVREADTPDTLAGRVFEQECIAYPHAIRLFAEGRLRIDGLIVHVNA